MLSAVARGAGSNTQGKHSVDEYNSHLHLINGPMKRADHDEI
jgi:hypothetical protein